ncbi:hypothetical protein DPMN_060672 [Dreissena polymorpha]|uniref:Uncharacterized protein n=1 Tax=Dreissena polymorpha TaxID=45954 RepID=A0A9D4HIG4_DREPO|nr:hypothetical protein DPMN_060672 [Dreissena polymorpha]
MIALISRELVAAEGHYHRSCYRCYTRQVTQNNDDIESDELNEEDLRNQFYTDAEKTAYAEIYKEIRDLFCVPKVVKLPELRESMKTHMRNGGVSELKESTRTHMFRKIKTEFNDSLNYT